ncbi:MAG: hypothetical protein U0556_09945 [Dehalococcoidia bacterium]
MIAPSRASAIADAILLELARQTAVIDATPDLTAVTVIVKLGERTGEPATVIFRTEAISRARRRSSANGRAADLAYAQDESV